MADPHQAATGPAVRRGCRGRGRYLDRHTWRPRASGAAPDRGSGSIRVRSGAPGAFTGCTGWSGATIGGITPTRRTPARAARDQLPAAVRPLRRSSHRSQDRRRRGRPGRYFNVDPLIFRVVFVTLAVFGGPACCSTPSAGCSFPRRGGRSPRSLRTGERPGHHQDHRRHLLGVVGLVVGRQLRPQRQRLGSGFAAGSPLWSPAAHRHLRGDTRASSTAGHGVRRPPQPPPAATASRRPSAVTARSTGTASATTPPQCRPRHRRTRDSRRPVLPATTSAHRRARARRSDWSPSACACSSPARWWPESRDHPRRASRGRARGPASASSASVSSSVPSPVGRAADRARRRAGGRHLHRRCLARRAARRVSATAPGRRGRSPACTTPTGSASATRRWTSPGCGFAPGQTIDVRRPSGHRRPDHHCCPTTVRSMSTPTSTPARSGSRGSPSRADNLAPEVRRPSLTATRSSRSMPISASAAWRCVVRRHEIDVVSLVAGLLFLGVAVVHMVAGATDTDLNLRWMAPGARGARRSRGAAGARPVRRRARGRAGSPRGRRQTAARGGRGHRRSSDPGRSGVGYPDCRRRLDRGRRWHPAGCPSGQWERTVNPSAKPTKVRILHLPPTRGRDVAVTPSSACSGAGRGAVYSRRACAPIAQSAEHLHGKEKVYGSIPYWGSDGSGSVPR